MASCGLQTGSMAVMVAADGVVAYVPNGTWSGGGTGIKRMVIEGGSATSQTIPTTEIVSSCASNWVTGDTICTTQSSNIYVVNGTTITRTVTNGATTQQALSGGFCLNCGVAIDAVANQAWIETGLTIGGRALGGFQPFDFATSLFGPAISAGANPGAASGYWTSENVAVDSVRHLILSPNEFGNYQLVKYGASPAAFDNLNFPKMLQNGNAPYFDSAAEDCITGIGLTVDEHSTFYVPDSASITLVDLTQAVFTPGTPNGTWTAPSNTQVLTGLPGRQGLEMTGISVASGSHLGILSDEFGGGTIIAFQLPSTSGTGTPALVDWAAAYIAKDPNGNGWGTPSDPHNVTAYVSPHTGRAMGLVANSANNGPPSWVAAIDLQSILNAPRVPGTHNVDPTWDLAANGALTFNALPCSQSNVYSDVNNCGSCGHACVAGPNAGTTCNSGNCRLQCYTGFADCNGVYADGCESHLADDPAHCGRCGTSCAAANATGVCTAGACSVRCNTGFSDCDGDPSNGCETAGLCGAPVTVSVSGPASVIVGDPSPTYVATANEPIPGRRLSYAWIVLSGPGAVTFASPSALTTTAEFFAAGSYVLQFEATDGYVTTVASVTVNAVLVNRPPVVVAGANQVLTAPMLTTTLAGSATDDGLPAGGTLSSTWSLVSGPTSVAIVTPTRSGVPEPGPITPTTLVTFAYPGTYVFQLDVSDSSLGASATTTVTVNPPAAPGSSPPTVALGGVTDDQEITKPTPILGTVSDGSWVLEKRLGGRDDVSTQWSVMASGTGAVNGTSVATFDPTLLLNGIYTLRLSATNSAGSSATSVSLSVNGRMKIGNFTLAFTDLDTVVGDLPLTVQRIYDSRDKTVGDFGVGWKLGIRDVRVEKSGKTGAYWMETFIDNVAFSYYCVNPAGANSVAITFPNGRQYRFVPEASPKCLINQPLTNPDIVWRSTSDPDNPTIKLQAINGNSTFVQGAGVGPVSLYDPQQNIWDPRQFTLTIEDASVWQIDQDLGVTAVRDLKGNTLTITPGGILHSSGKQATFTRDTKNRITSITDPAGHAMTYAYDANGDLVTYNDRLANVTQFTYFPNHYLDQIQDPLGRLPIRNVYDLDGRLVSSTDAVGQTVRYTPNLAANQEQVTDRLGHVTLYTYNDRGDVTQKQDATGHSR